VIAGAVATGTTATARIAFTIGGAIAAGTEPIGSSTPPSNYLDATPATSASLDATFALVAMDGSAASTGMN
jgi:hypothetical protein